MLLICSESLLYQPKYVFFLRFSLILKLNLRLALHLKLLKMLSFAKTEPVLIRDHSKVPEKTNPIWFETCSPLKHTILCRYMRNPTIIYQRCHLPAKRAILVHTSLLGAIALWNTLYIGGVRLEEKLRNKVEIALPVLTVFSFLQSGLRFLIDL